jgi:senataxin
MFFDRYCLWILGNGTTLLASNSIWAELVKDSKKRGCFFDALKDRNLAETMWLATKVMPLLCENKGLCIYPAS